MDSFLKESSPVYPIDASWYMPNVPVNAYNEFQKERLNKNAIYFDIDKISDTSSPYPHMLPSVGNFEKHVGKLGISNDSSLLFYDQQGIFSVCRAAWMFEVFGHDPEKLYILNTFPSYKQAFSDPNLVMVVHEMRNTLDHSLVEGPSPHDQSTYKASLDESKVVTYEKLLDLLKQGKIGTEYTLLDARAHDRFTGRVKEPRPGLPSGHVPGAVNTPFSEFLTPDKSFLSTMTITKVANRLGINESKPIIIMCGTGVTACIVRSALILAGFDPARLAVYDGSWTEYGQRAPKELIAEGE
ncbi:DEKNAAC102063 [Brettanomyces naardenensis]|uniref:DEKNAAC102063 n=1 Tax=Brettanomyces naardenensis TaxID=13370 RepID=A0A448YJY9_BRENA|nr:DEKNAAC102063 [Brettanomyces naardenensis]